MKSVWPLAMLVVALVVAPLGMVVGQEKGEGKKSAANVAAEVMPGLSTSDRIALQACEKQKQEAQQSYQQAQQQEGVIANEWREKNKGWHLNPTTYAVEKDAVAEKSSAKTAGSGDVPTPVAPVKK